MTWIKKLLEIPLIRSGSNSVTRFITVLLQVLQVLYITWQKIKLKNKENVKMSKVEIKAIIEGTSTVLSGVAISYTVSGVAASGTTDDSGV